MAERHVRLKAPAGVVAVEYGGQTYAVENGHVCVPIMAEPALTRRDMGFVFPDEPRPVYQTTLKVAGKKR